MGDSAAWANSTLYGAYDPRQQESLWNTAIELQAQGRHEEAIPVLKRATHLSRINEGLDAASQLPYVRAEIQSYRALDELALADERHAYLSRIEKQVLPSGPERIDAFLRQAEWHQYALLEDIDEDEAIQARMGKAWNFYRRALNESVATYGESSADLLPALHGMVRAQYLLAGHQRWRRNARQTDETRHQRPSQKLRLSEVSHYSSHFSSLIEIGYRSVAKLKPKILFGWEIGRGGQVIVAMRSSSMVMQSSWQMARF